MGWREGTQNRCEPSQVGYGKSQILVLNRVRVLGNGLMHEKEKAKPENELTGSKVFFKLLLLPARDATTRFQFVR